MFNLSGSEIVFLLVAGLVVLGPERLPGVIRTVGKVYGEVRRTAKGFEKEITETFREPIEDFRSATRDLSVGFGEVDTDPSPPMRPELSRPASVEGDSAATLPETPDIPGASREDPSS